jgi:hypothetical protein
MINAKGISTNYSYNDKQQLISVTTDNRSVNYSYNSNNLLYKITQGNKEYNFIYDEFLNSKKIMIGENITLVENEYEENNGNLYKSIYGNNHEITFDYDSFDRVLRFVGFRCLLEIGVNFNKDTILNAIRQAKEFCGNIEFDESDFLKDLISTVPLFCQEGTDYKWVHKSLLEYFAARFIFCDAKDQQDKILSAIYKSDNINKYTNLLDLYYSIDFNGFNKNIIYPFCKEYISYYDSIPSEEMSISKELIEERKSKLFVNRYFAGKQQSSKEFIIEFTRKNKGFERAERIVFKSGKCVIKFSSTLSVIEKLLYNHSKELFSSNIYSYGSYVRFFHFIENIENSCFDEIDIKKCNEDNMIYENLNVIMDIPSCRQPRYYLNYNACKKVVEDFEQKLKDESAKSELLKGL